MAASAPNFEKILGDTIEQAGAGTDPDARREIYDRARRTVVERARAAGAPNTAALEAMLSDAVDALEARYGPAVDDTDAALSIAPIAPIADEGAGDGPEDAAETEVFYASDDDLVSATSGLTRAAEIDGLSDGLEPQEPVSARAGSDQLGGEDQSQSTARRLFGRIAGRFSGESGAAEAEAAPEPPPIAPAPPSATPPDRDIEAAPDAPVLAARDDDALAGRIAEITSILDAPPAAAPPSASAAPREPAPTGDPLDRIAADLEAGFRDLEFDVLEPDKPAAEADLDLFVPGDASDGVHDSGKTPKPRQEVTASPEPDGPAVFKEPRVEPDTDRKADAAEGTQKDPSVFARAQKRFSLPRVAPKAAGVGLVAVLVLAAALYAAFGPEPGAPGASGRSTGIIPDAADLTSDGWVARSVSLSPVNGYDWTAYRLTDTDADRLGQIAAPLNEMAVKDGFVATVRIAKSDQRVPNFAVIRIVMPMTRAPKTHDLIVDLTTGEIRHSGAAAAGDIAVIDDGDSWRLILSARLPDGVFFAKPRLEIFPAMGTTLGDYDPGATGSAVVGDITVSPL